MGKPCPSYDFGMSSAPSQIYLLSFLGLLVHDKIARQGDNIRLTHCLQLIHVEFCGQCVLH